jgi:hypothetical protein
MHHITIKYHSDSLSFKDIIVLLSDLLTINTSLAGQLNKVETEVLGKFAELQAAIDNLTAQLADAPLSEAQALAVNDVVAAAQRLDDLNPDSVPEPTPEPVPEPPVDAVPVETPIDEAPPV